MHGVVSGRLSQCACIFKMLCNVLYSYKKTNKGFMFSCKALAGQVRQCRGFACDAECGFCFCSSVEFKFFGWLFCLLSNLKIPKTKTYLPKHLSQLVAPGTDEASKHPGGRTRT